ncbi:pectinesterase inhibitor 9-like [Typha angustifolia]|uniref:pectinesterase inhibitor 9-like n=1 Tax=Typha angustifolia TaxID=59011 RepID=UPI003C2B320F
MRVFGLFLVVLTLGVVCSSASTHTGSPPPTDFILTSCKTTRYSDLCVRSLTRYGPAVHRSRRQLAYAALTICAARARSTSYLVTQMTSGSRPSRSTHTGPVLDCTKTMKDSTDRLRQAVREMNRMGRPSSKRFKVRLSNIQAWVSGALTDATTCLQSLDQDVIPLTARAAAIRKKVVEFSQYTSNTLALINQLELRN